ncbi:MurR/RpiR family transcriptional regulator [Vibrio rumoiensis]|uniref:XRE family transcriptional regulator n=1 Tax=Vibrio rumoiensis 1S-45 TaxID=1188252 RepID=A0A1E5E4F8_9VIBR|nr:SIS domain-containing protein [Vibrio rumoiensis]OEF27674.1 XRE family transcriptional regulator [Vibrio rumoiensis 1S-45]
MSILTKLRYHSDQFSVNEKNITDVILGDPIAVTTMSSQSLADTCQVSQSSIVKFTQKLGCKGFTAFKVAISEELGRQHAIIQDQSNLHNQISASDTLLDVAQKLAQEKTNSILQTTNHLNAAEFSQVVKALNVASKVQIAGIGGSALVAKDLSYKLMKIGIPTLNEFDSHVQITIANTLKPKDVFLVLSYSGHRKDMQFAAEVAKKKGALVVAITSLGHSPLRSIADITLDTIAEEPTIKEQGSRSSSISSRTAQHTIIDLLFMSLVQNREGDATSLIRDVQGAIDTLSK